MATRAEKRAAQAAEENKMREQRSMDAENERMQKQAALEQQRKNRLIQALTAELKSTAERYFLVYGLPYEDVLTSLSGLVLATLDAIHVDNQKILLPQMMDILEQRESALFADAEAQDEAPAIDPNSPAAKIGKKAKGK